MTAMQMLSSKRFLLLIGDAVSGKRGACSSPLKKISTLCRSGLRASRVTGSSRCQTLSVEPVSCFHCSVLLEKASPTTSVLSENGETQPSSTPLLDSVKDRGLYHEDVYRHWRHHKVKDLSLLDEGRLVNIVWNDGHTSRFHAVWLRHNCVCPDCRVSHNNMVDLDELDVGQRVKTVRMEEGEEIVEFTWTDSAGRKTHTGHILTTILRKACYSTISLEEKHRQRAMPFHAQKTIPEVDYTEVLESDEGLYKWLKGLSDKGICLVKNVPTTLNKLLEVAHRIGPSYHGVYGLVFNVVSEESPIDAAYTSERLYHHMDQIQQECPPGLQFLHCLKFDESIEGGENQFVDAYEVALQLREEHPDLFDTLCMVPCNPQTIDCGREYKVEMYYQRTIFSLNHRGELINVSWHPTIQGPLAVDYDDVIPFYKAYTKFAHMIEYHDSKYHLRLKPGDLITFNNRRLTHNRTAFTSGGERHLQGTYVDSSIFQSKVQHLRSKFEDGLLVPHCGSMNWQ